MDLRRRDFIRAGGGWLLSLAARPLRGQAERPAGPAPEPRVVLTWGTNGHAEGQFDIPIAIVIDRKDEILITDFRQSDPEAKGRLQRFDPSGRFLGAFELEPMPGGLALDKEGLLYATHMMRHKVAVYDRTGRRVPGIGRPGDGPRGIPATRRDRLRPGRVALRRRPSEPARAEADAPRRAYQRLGELRRQAGPVRRQRLGRIPRRRPALPGVRQAGGRLHNRGL